MFFMELWQVWTTISVVPTAWRLYVIHYLNLGWMQYVIMHRHKYFCYYLFNIKKRDLPKWTGPFT